MEKIISPKFLVVVAGPTAVGKTDFCVQLAKHFGTDIISADSRQFYKEMTIGTAKPSAAEQQGVVHHFVDSHSILQEYNAGAYEQEVLQLLSELFRQQDLVILTGGSGLYINAVCNGMDAMPEADLLLRGQLMEKHQHEGLAPLLEQLQQLDPAYYAQVDRANPQRVIRALEVCLSTGQPYSGFRQNQRQQRPFHIIKICLNRDRQELYQRINQRMDQMLAQGLLQEAEALYPFRQHNALQTVGYQELFDFMEGKYGWEEAVRLLKRNSRRYAKRQLTWFNRDPEYHWFHPEQWQEVLDFLKAEMSRRR